MPVGDSFRRSFTCRSSGKSRGLRKRAPLVGKEAANRQRPERGKLQPCHGIPHVWAQQAE